MTSRELFKLLTLPLLSFISMSYFVCSSSLTLGLTLHITSDVINLHFISCENFLYRPANIMTPERFEFWRRFLAGAGLGFSYSVGIAKPYLPDGTEEEEEDSWHKVSIIL